MSEYIEKQKIEKFIEDGLNNPDKNKSFGHDAIEIMAEIHYMTSEDVAPVIHGKWIGYDASYYRNYNFGKHPVNLIRFKCSICGKTVSKKEKYCHCGAKMD